MHTRVVLLFGLLLAMPAFAQGIPEAAQRHVNRGMAAIEIARTPRDYELAIDEFRQARALAPQWPDVHYNLGLVQEKAGRLKDAAVSLREYLRLAPNAADAATVRTLADKIEFKAEQSIGDDEVPAIFASLADAARWRVVAATPAEQFDFHLWIRAIRREGERLAITYRSRHDRTTMDYATPAGKRLDFRTIYSMCPSSVQADECPEVFDYKLEVVSRRLVRVKLRIFFPDIAGQVKAYVTDKNFELVAR